MSSASPLEAALRACCSSSVVREFESCPASAQHRFLEALGASMESINMDMMQEAFERVTIQTKKKKKPSSMEDMLGMMTASDQAADPADPITRVRIKTLQLRQMRLFWTDEVRRHCSSRQNRDTCGNIIYRCSHTC